MKWAAVSQDIDLQQERLKASGLSYIIYGGYTAAARLQIRYGFWNEATKSLRQSLDAHELKSGLACGYLNGLLHFAQGMEAIEKNKPAAAEMHLKALDDLIQQLVGEKVQWGSDWYSSYGKKNLEVSALELRGALLNLQGRQTEAIQLLQEGAQKEKELGYWEPPHYSRPVLESLAQIYLQAKKWEEARETHRQILRLRPNSGHALLGLARAFWGEGSKDHAAQAYAEFLQAWAQADATLPQIKEAKARLASGTH